MNSSKAIRAEVSPLNPTKTQPAWMQVVSLVFSALLAGAMLGMAWQKEPLGWLGVGGLALFFLVQARLRNLLPLLVHALVTGFTSFALACPWLPSTIRFLAETEDTTYSCFFAVVYYAIQSFGLIAFALLWRLARGRQREAWLLVPLIWIGVEQVVPTLFPWPPAILLSGDLPMLQVAELGGVQLASLLVLAIAVFLAWSVEQSREYFSSGHLEPRKLVVWLLLLVGLLGIRFWGSARAQAIEVAMDQKVTSALRVGLVQADTSYVDSNQRMIEVTREMQGKIDLALWPESALGDYCRILKDFNDPDLVTKLSLGEDTRFVPFPDPHCPLLAGADTWDDDEVDGQPDRHFVSALLIDQGECLVASREKVRLMPYGEYIPGEGLLPFMRSWFGSQKIISPGTSVQPIGEIKDFRIGVLLCCEDMHPDLVRQIVAEGANLLVTLGNGLAFDSEIALRQHFRIAKLRAIEHRLYFLRCTSSGVSGLVTPTGEVQQELPVLEDAALILTVPHAPKSLGPTLFTQYGWLPVCGISLITVLFWGAGLRSAGLNSVS